MLELHFFADYLTGSSCLARMQKIAAAKLFRRDANGARHLVPVTLGLFDDADGLVQATGSGLAAGQRVVVPAL